MKGVFLCWAILLPFLKGTHNTPQHFFGKFQSLQSFRPVFHKSSVSQQQSYRNQTPFIGYGPDYFKTLGNSKPNQQCPVVSANCFPGRYRSFNGSCNNLIHPAYGAANTPYGRLMPPKYSDGVQSPPLSVTGKELPNSRKLSVTLFPRGKSDDPLYTLATMQWGQLIAHDMSLASGTTNDEQKSADCCGARNNLHGSLECFPIDIPPEDFWVKRWGQHCKRFARSRTDKQLGCPMKYKSAQQYTTVSHWIDGSTVYGSDDQWAQSVRAFQGGKLLSEFREGREWPPENVNRSSVCEGFARKGIGSCYMAGDGRVNQNTQLTVLQVLLLREHNRIASKLFELNPHWNDETLYQETRRIVIAEIQHITYYEWLPILLGQENLLKFKIIYKPRYGYVNDYKEDIDPSVLNEHATAAYRLFHSSIQGYLNLITENRQTHGSIRLSDYFNNPTILEESNNFDDLLRGLATQPQGFVNWFLTSEVTEYLFRDNKKVGTDLRAIDIQRGRDHGLASYNDLRGLCEFKKAHSFDEFADFIELPILEKLQELYAHPDDVDLVVGGALEKLVPGTLAGPINTCILMEQFYRTRVADRFFYERGDYEAAFSPEQLNEIRKISLARLMCDNGDNILSMQPKAFQRPSEQNPLTSCYDYTAIPSVNLEAWRDLSVQPSVYTVYYLH